MSDVHRGVYHCHSYPEYIRLPPYQYLPRVTQLYFSPHYTPPVPPCFLRVAFCPTNSYCPMFPAPVLQRHQLHPPQYTVVQSSPTFHHPSYTQRPPVTPASPPLTPHSPHISSDLPAPSSSPSSALSSSSSTLEEDEHLKYQKIALQLQRLRTALGYSHADVGQQLGHLCHTVFSGSTISSFESGGMPVPLARKIQPAVQLWLQVTLSKCEMEPSHAPVLAADKKKFRTSIDHCTREKLEVYFKSNNKPLPSEIVTIAQALELDKGIVQTWFCNRRQREKRKTTFMQECKEIPSSGYCILQVVDDSISPRSVQSAQVYIDQPLS